MQPNQTMIDENSKQVCLFPLVGFAISQPWWGTFTHDQSRYYATDFVPYDSNGNRIFRAPCYAPVDIKLLWYDTTECCALWQSVDKVHFANGSIDYLGIIVYHDNDIANGTYSNVGDIIRQGQIFNRTGTGGNVTGDHVHLETGIGEVNLNQYRYHFLDNTDCRRLVPDDALFINDTLIVASSFDSGYSWSTYADPLPTSLRRYGQYGMYYGNDYNSSQALSLIQMQINAQYIYRALTDKGWTLNAIAGVLGNMQTESSINPRTLAK